MVQAVICAHPNAPVPPVSKDGLDQIGGQAIALGKRFHLPFRTTRLEGIAKCGRIQPLDPSAPRGCHPEISAAIKSRIRKYQKKERQRSRYRGQHSEDRRCRLTLPLMDRFPNSCSPNILLKVTDRKRGFSAAIREPLKVAQATLQPEKTMLRGVSPECSV